MKKLTEGEKFLNSNIIFYNVVYRKVEELLIKETHKKHERS